VGWLRDAAIESTPLPFKNSGDNSTGLPAEVIKMIGDKPNGERAMQRTSVFRRAALALAGAAMAFLVDCHAGIAQDVEDTTREACTPDALRLCGLYVLSVERITNCMTAKIKQVSPQCRIAMIKEDNRARARLQGRPREF
jgi:hypothetical protein